MSDDVYSMLVGKLIEVPTYQRAYAWDTSTTPSAPKQVDTFFSDITDYINSKSKSRYYLGHFLFEALGENKFAVIDGQQRLTTLIIFLAVLFKRLESMKKLNDADREKSFATLKRFSNYPFSTVEYDRQFFRDFIIDSRPSIEPDTVSQRRIIEAYDFFWKRTEKMSEDNIRKYIDSILKASCTTQVVNDEAEAIQTFIFQNDRGKVPTTLEVIKAQFMLAIQISVQDDSEKQTMLSEIKSRFQTIYKKISEIEDRLEEDEVLRYALRIYYKSLNESNTRMRVAQELGKNGAMQFIKDFTLLLEQCFKIMGFVVKEERHSIDMHILRLVGIDAIVLPILITSLLLNPDSDMMRGLVKNLASLSLRHSTIGTRADLTSRLNDVFERLATSNDIQGMIDRIEWLKTTQDWWWAYWNNNAFIDALSSDMSTRTAKKLLYAYEVLLANKCKKNYSLFHYDSGVAWEVEHIAPQTENPGSGYSKYTQKFIDECINTLGNYLLISKSHNTSIGNSPFAEKRKTYTYLAQQREIQNMTTNNIKWTGEKIRKRKKNIIDMLMSKY